MCLASTWYAIHFLGSAIITNWTLFLFVKVLMWWKFSNWKCPNSQQFWMVMMINLAIGIVRFQISCPRGREKKMVSSVGLWTSSWRRVSCVWGKSSWINSTTFLWVIFTGSFQFTEYNYNKKWKKVQTYFYILSENCSILWKYTDISPIQNRDLCNYYIRLGEGDFYFYFLL